MNEKGFFEYIVRFFDEDSVNEQETYGVTFAESFAEAIYNIEKAYSNIENVKVQGLEPSYCYDFHYDSILFNYNIKAKEK